MKQKKTYCMVRLSGTVLLLLLTLSASPPKKKPFDIEAHQGGSGLYPGNSIPAFIHALDLGVTTLEMDAVISKDSLVVVSHDPFMRHATMLTPDGREIGKDQQENFALFQMPYDSIRQYRLGVKFDPEFPERQQVRTHMPLLSEVIDSVETHIRRHRLKPVRYNIEVKAYKEVGRFHPSPEVFTDLLMGVLKKAALEKRVLIQSFDVRPLQHVRQRYPGIPVSYLLSKNNPNSLAQNLEKLGFRPEVISPEHPLVTPDFVREVRKLNMELIPWTVDQEADMRRLLDLQVDGIITNYPDRLQRLLSKR